MNLILFDIISMQYNNNWTKTFNRVARNILFFSSMPNNRFQKLPQYTDDVTHTLTTLMCFFLVYVNKILENIGNTLRLILFRHISPRVTLVWCLKPHTSQLSVAIHVYATILKKKNLCIQMSSFLYYQLTSELLFSSTKLLNQLSITNWKKHSQG